MDSTTQTKASPSNVDMMKVFQTVLRLAGETATDPTTPAMVGLFSGLLGHAIEKKTEKPAEPAKSESCCPPPEVPRAVPSVDIMSVLLDFPSVKPADPQKPLKAKIHKAFEFVFSDVVEADEFGTHFVAAIATHEKNIWNGFKSDQEAHTVLTFLFPETEEAKLHKLATLLTAPLL
jgi:hypothetical protein